MTTDTIKEFLVSVGFDVNEQQLKKFKNAIGATDEGMQQVAKSADASNVSVMSLLPTWAKAVLSVAGGVKFLNDASKSLDELSKKAIRAGSSAETLRAFGYAAEQVGFSADAAQNSVENLARFMRNTPQSENFLNNLGVNTRDLKGKLKDSAVLIEAFLEKTKKMTYPVQLAFGSLVGINEDTIRAYREHGKDFKKYEKESLEHVKDAQLSKDDIARNHEFRLKMSSGADLAEAVKFKAGATSAEIANEIIVDFLPLIYDATRFIANSIGYVPSAVHAVKQGLSDKTAPEEDDAKYSTWDKTKRWFEAVAGLTPNFKAFSGATIQGWSTEETQALINNIVFKENRGMKLDLVNKAGYGGLYQFGAEALAQTGYIDAKKLPKNRFRVLGADGRNHFDSEAHKDFLADKSNWLKGDWSTYLHNRQMQDDAMSRLMNANLQAGHGVTGDNKKAQAGFIEASHIGGYGRARNWYLNKKDSKDGNGTKTSSYALDGERLFQNYVQPQGSNTQNITQNLTTTTHINAPSGDAKAIAKEVATAQNSVMQNMARNTKTLLH